MAKQKKRTAQPLDSFIPTLKTEEKRLDDLLTDARARAEALVREAEKQAAARLASQKDGLPGLLEAERKKRRATMEQNAEAAAQEEEAAARTVEARAREALPEATRFIVRLVWPEPLPEEKDT